MPSDYARRGRSRGSGLDDRMQLRRIAELLEADPSLRPTTAIKALGVSDPSTIRRLRDKLKGEPHEQGAPSAAEIWPASAPNAGACLEAQEAVSKGSSPVRQADPEPAGLMQSSPVPAGPDPKFSWFAQWCALGLSAVSSTVEAQMALMDDLFRVPQVESALRQQLLLNEMAKAFYPKRSDIRSTLH